MRTSTLGSVCQINPSSDKGLSPEQCCSFIPMEAVDDKFGVITHKQTRRIAEVNKGYTPFRDNDVLFAKITPCMENGKCAIASRLTNGIGFGSTEFHVLRGGNEALPAWIFFFLRQDSVRQEAERNMTGSAGQKRVPAGFLSDLEIPLPPLPEQQRLAALLDKADHLRRARRYAQQLSDTFLQSVFLEMFGDPATNPKGWDIETVGNQISSIRYGTGSPPAYQNEGIPFVRATNVKHGTIEPAGMAFISAKDAARIPKCRIRIGDMVIVRSGANTGDSAIIPAVYDGAYAAYDLIIELSPILGYFYNFLINSEYGKGIIEPLTRRSGQPHLNAEQVSSLRFPLPPLTMLEQFAQIVRRVERLRAQQREAARQAEHLFQTLLHRAFRGEI